MAFSPDDAPVPSRRPHITGDSPLPPAGDVRAVLTTLLERDVELTPGPELGPATPAVIGVYTDDLGRPEAVIALDVHLARHLSAALALLPPARADLASDALAPAVLEDATEVLNVMKVLLEGDDGPHRRLHRVLDASVTPPPHEVAAWMRSHRPRLDVDAEVQGYGGGRLSIVVNAG
ncbi:hypothetical protein [Georgenia thermotolerans]|uniref:Uncharacterized protein n=1 Tax=Georgenia thermotolerans TaxID=527326 RepID=A0A7J5UKC4_9MICO|nr:hypothetical protein [Georgenia thermotolerans]KAE8762807.1 hypothetical protein GB883_17495 [Georgenia thermotolerans]